MSGFEDKLNAILNDQQAMGQIMALAQSLSGPEQQGKEGREAPPAKEGEYVPVWPEQEKDASPPAAGLPDVSNLLGSIDPRMMQMGMRLLQEYNRADDRNAALLAALRPFLKEERFARMDRAIQIARLSRVIRVLYDTWKENGGKLDV